MRPLETIVWSLPNVWSPGTWLADVCAAAGLPVVLGPALAMKAIHGGKATPDTMDAQKIAVLRRGGRLPQASGYPAARRATRALLRRRRHLAPKRGEVLAHVQHPNRPSYLPAIGKTIASKANRDGSAERVADPAVHQRLAVDLSRIDDDAHRLRDVDRSLLNAAQPHDANTLELRRPVPGLGTILRRVRWYDSHAIDRFPRVPACASYGRLVKCAKAAAGTRAGTAETKLGQAHLTWAFADAAV